MHDQSFGPLNPLIGDRRAIAVAPHNDTYPAPVKCQGLRPNVNNAGGEAITADPRLNPKRPPNCSSTRR